VIPVTLICLYACAPFAGGLIVLGMAYSLNFTTIWTDLTGEKAKIAAPVMLIVGHVELAIGCLLLLGGSNLWVGRWWRGIAYTVLGFACIGAMVSAERIIGRLLGVHW
jgi:hypothetical protein